MTLMTVDKPSIKSSAKILLLEAGSLDRVRNWDDKGHWENRISSLTAQNVEWLKRELRGEDKSDRYQASEHGSTLLKLGRIPSKR